MNNTIPTPQFNPMTAGMVAPVAQKESKTNDFRINLVAEDGSIVSAGIVKVWKRHDADTLDAIIKILSSHDSVVEITSMDEEASSGAKPVFKV